MILSSRHFLFRLPSLLKFLLLLPHPYFCVEFSTLKRYKKINDDDVTIILNFISFTMLQKNQKRNSEMFYKAYCICHSGYIFSVLMLETTA